MSSKLNRLFFPAALFLVGAAALSIPRGYSLGFYLICIIGFILWLGVRGDLIPNNARYILWPMLIYAVGHLLLALHERWAVKEIEVVMPYFLVLFGFWCLRKYKPDSKWFWRGLATGAILSAVISSYQAIMFEVRAGGFGNHPIQFGNLALLMGVLCLVRSLLIRRINLENIFLWTGFISGLIASLCSQARGGWVAVLLIVAWILMNATKGMSLFRRFMVAFIITGILLMPLMQTNGIVQVRINSATEEFKAFFEKGTQDTSIGARLAVWQLALYEINKSPWLGAGNAGWAELRDSAIADGRLHSFAQKFGHLHNEYLNELFKRGFVGLALLLLLYTIPMIYFFRPYLDFANVEVRALAIAGMVVPMMYMDFGLSQTFLSHNSGRIFYCGLLMCAAALMLNSVEQNEEYDGA